MRKANIRPIYPRRHLTVLGEKKYIYIGIKKWLERYHNKNHQGINQKPIEKYRNAA